MKRDIKLYDNVLVQFFEMSDIGEEPAETWKPGKICYLDDYQIGIEIGDEKMAYPRNDNRWKLK